MNRLLPLAFLSLGLLACEDPPTSSAAPSATTLEDTKPKAATAVSFQLASDSKVGFTMEAPNEKIRGRVEEGTKGEIDVDIRDLSKTTGHLYVDLMKLELFQRLNENGEFTEESKSDLQNQHARDWLEIGSCAEADDKAACEDQKKKNENVEFVVEKVVAEHNDLTKLTGAERKTTATVTGEFLLHQKATEKTAKVEITVRMKGDEPASVEITTVEPFKVGLAEHDVRPRTAFGAAAAKTIKTLENLINDDKKIAEAADVTFELHGAVGTKAEKSASK
ncbi:MAG: hypothetical protein KC731_05915 [Myxococcales bacterium]|nr:hypothetical protein [Myxococcales bacterium]